MFDKKSLIDTSGFSGDQKTTQVATNPNKSLAEAIAEANGNMKDISTAEIVDHRELPSSLNVEVISPADAQADDITVALFNEDLLEATPTNNDLATGTDGAAVTVDYKDGRSGKVYNRLMSNYGGGRGILIKEITCIAKVNSSGAANEEFFNTCDMAIFTPTGKGGKEKPLSIDWSEAVSNGPNKTGIYTLKCNIRLHSLNQIRYTQEPDTKINFVFKVDRANS